MQAIISGQGLCGITGFSAIKVEFIILTKERQLEQEEPSQRGTATTNYPIL